MRGAGRDAGVGEGFGFQFSHWWEFEIPNEWAAPATTTTAGARRAMSDRLALAYAIEEAGIDAAASLQAGYRTGAARLA